MAYTSPRNIRDHHEIHEVITPSLLVRQQLDALKKEIEHEQNEQKRRLLARAIARLEQFDKLQQENTNTKEETLKIIREIIGNTTPDTYKNSDLLTLRKHRVDIASLTLVYTGAPSKVVTSSDIKENDTFTVNFGDNKSLHHRTGAGDILPATVRTITINGEECERRHTPRPGYYNAKGKYVPIYDGYEISIVRLGDATQEDTVAMEQQWKNERMMDTVASGGKALSALKEDQDLQNEAKAEIKTITSTPKGEALWNRPSFQAKLQPMCERLGINPEHLKVVMHKESSINPHAVNRTSGATGLIQFMPNTALGLGTTVYALRRMSAEEQLDYVEKYFAPYKGKLNSVEDLYMATFYPYALGKGRDFVIGSERSASWASLVARQNPGITKFAPGKHITVAAFHSYVNARV